jgi:hypothetical protein
VGAIKAKGLIGTTKSGKVIYAWGGNLVLLKMINMFNSIAMQPQNYCNVIGILTPLSSINKH